MDAIRPNDVFKEAKKPKNHVDTLKDIHIRLGPYITHRCPDVWGTIQLDLLLGCCAKSAWRCGERGAGSTWEAPSRGSS